MLYEELKGCKKNPLQERLSLLVTVRRQLLDFQRLEILALAGMNEQNGKAVQAALEAYHRRVFGKIHTQKDAWLEDAKRQLANEAKNVYLVTPKTVNKGRGALLEAAKSQHPQVAKMAAHLLKAEAHALQSLHARPKKPIPTGVPHEKR